VFIKIIASFFALTLTVSAANPADKEPSDTDPGKHTSPQKGDSNKVAIINTKFGRMVIEFFPDVAPGHVNNFKKLAKEGFYDGTVFHRVIPGFMIQGGDPISKDPNVRHLYGTGGPGYTIKAEFSQKHHERGIVSMARGMDPDSAGSQFFICVADAFYLDEKYTVFGKVVEGMDVADKIVAAPRDRKDNPLERIEIKVEIIDKDKLKR